MRDNRRRDDKKQGGDGILKAVLLLLVILVAGCFLFGTEKGSEFLENIMGTEMGQTLQDSASDLPGTLKDAQSAAEDLYKEVTESRNGTETDGSEGVITDVTSDGTAVYDALYAALAAYQTSVTLDFDVSEVNMDHLSDIYRQMLEDHPELFWLTGGVSWNGLSYINRSTYTFTPMMEAEADVSMLPQMQAEMDAQVDAIIADAAQQDSTYNMALRVHDILVRTCEYDSDAAARISEDEYTTDTNFSVSAYGALVNHRAVCSGYAKAYQLILNRMGIPCGYVSGAATNENGTVGHAWNSLVIDGQTYYVDVTWDDPVGSDDAYVSRDYFCLTEEEILQDHTPDQ